MPKYERRIYDNPQLTDHQKAVLFNRLTAGTDSEAARIAGVVPSTVTNWKKTKPHFIKAYTDLMNFRDHAITHPEEFEEEDWHEKYVPIAFAKLGQILDIDIDENTKASIIAQVRQAADRVLTGTGHLRGLEVGSLSITQIIQNFVESGKPENTYTPGFKVIEGKLAIEGDGVDT